MQLSLCGDDFLCRESSLCKRTGGRVLDLSWSFWVSLQIGNHKIIFNASVSYWIEPFDAFGADLGGCLMLDTHCVHFFCGRVFQLQGPHRDGKLFQRPLSETFQQKCWVILNVNPNPTSLEVKADPKSETQLSCHLKKYPESSLLCQVTFSKLYNKRTSPDKAAQHTGPIPDVFLASVTTWGDFAAEEWSPFFGGREMNPKFEFRGFGGVCLPKPTSFFQLSPSRFEKKTRDGFKVEYKPCKEATWGDLSLWGPQRDVTRPKIPKTVIEGDSR